MSSHPNPAVCLPDEDNSKPCTSSEIQIVDLQPLLQSEFGQQCGLDVTDTSEWLGASALISESAIEDDLYSKYLNGLLSFDDLMRELHRSESSVDKKRGQLMETDDDCDTGEDDDANSNSEGSSDPDYTPSRSTSDPKVRKTRVRNRLSVELAQYLGEAERHLNTDDFDDAEKICRDIISAAPNCSAPFIVLAEVFYRRGDQEKATEYLFEAAKRSPSDVNLWTSLVDMAEEKGDLALATYYTRLALRSSKHAVDLRRRLIQYCEKAGRKREALLLRLSALTISPESSGAKQFELARSLADQFFKLGDRQCSIRAYESAFEVYPDGGTDADKNTPLSMMLQLQKYENALKFYIRFCGVIVKTGAGKTLRWDRLAQQLKRPNRYTQCSYPPDMPPELFLKLFIVMVNLKLSNACTTLIQACFTDELAEKFPDWLLDIVKAYRSVGLHSAAGELLSKLTTLESTKNFPTVWIMLAEIQVEQGAINSAIESYKHVLDVLAPRHAEARLALGSLLNRVGRTEDALELLKPSNLPQRPRKQGRRQSRRERKDDIDVSSSPVKSVAAEQSPRKLADKTSDILKEVDETVEGAEVDDDEEDDDDDDDEDEGDASDNENVQAQASLLKSQSITEATLMSHDPVAYRMAFERCRMLDHPSTLDDFMDEAWNLLFTDVARFCGPLYFNLLFLFQNYRLRARLMEQLGSNAKAVHNVSEKSAVSKERNVSNVDIWTLYVRLVDLLMARLPGSLKHLEVAATWGYFLPAIHGDEGRRATTGNLLVSSSMIAGHGALAFVKLREMYKQWSHRNQYWNLLNLSILMSRRASNYRSLFRLMEKESTTLPLKIITNNDCFSRGSYRFSTARLIGIRETNPNDPLILLMLAVSFLGIAMQKFVTSRHPPVLQAFAFFSEYRRVRGECQEVYYNIARACQQLCLDHMAIHYYEKVLSMEPVGNTDQEKSYTDLRREAAFNLMLLYRSKGNLAMAHHLIQTYLVI